MTDKDGLQAPIAQGAHDPLYPQDPPPPQIPQIPFIPNASQAHSAPKHHIYLPIMCPY